MYYLYSWTKVWKESPIWLGPWVLSETGDRFERPAIIGGEVVHRVVRLPVLGGDGRVAMSYHQS